MSNQRDELARDIFIADNAGQSREASLKDWDAYVAGSGTDTYAHNIADGLLAAGWTKPRTITTPDELDALAEWSVILDRGLDTCVNRLDGWLSSEEMELYAAASIPLPATVIFEPTA